MTIKTLPVELLKIIATELPDKDLCSFVLACRTLYDAVQGDQVVWRSHFLRTFDKPAKSKNAYDWKTMYQKRQSLLLGDMVFQSGGTVNELEALGVLRDILLDAYSYRNSETDLVHGRNFTPVRLARATSSLFLSCLYEYPHPLLSAVSLLLTPILDLPEQKHLTRMKEIVYNAGRDEIITIGGTPNIHVLSILAGFFTWHLHFNLESNLFHQKVLLTVSEVLDFWEGRSGDEEDGMKVPMRWFGTYAYMNYARVMTPEILIGGCDNFPTEMRIFFSPSKRDGTETTFTAIGRDFSDFTVTSGSITPIPSPPELSMITGWKKVQFVKSYTSFGWLYEGVMFPGNNMILGYWRGSEDYMTSVTQFGPFCFWSASEDSPGIVES